MASINNVRGDKYIFTITNGTGADKIVALLAAFYDTLKLVLTEGAPNTFVLNQTNPAEVVKAGYACDAVVDDGIIITAGTNLVCTPINAKKTYRAFRKFIQQQSKVVRGMSIQANNLAAFNQTMDIVQCSPLGGDVTTSIPLVALRDGMSNLNDVVTLDGTGLAIGFDTLILLPVLNGHQLTITFWF
jgi:hypothetical protein